MIALNVAVVANAPALSIDFVYPIMHASPSGSVESSGLAVAPTPLGLDQIALASAIEAVVPPSRLPK